MCSTPLSSAGGRPTSGNSRAACRRWRARDWHGFVGGFNERLLEAAEAALEASDALFVLGGRGALFAAERGRQVAWTSPMATRPASVPRSVSELAAALYSRIMRGEISRVEVMFDRYRQGSPSVIEHALLLPRERERGPLRGHGFGARQRLEKT